MLSNKSTKSNEEKILSEKLILSRYKTDDICKIKKLNLWGYKLTDISILKEMPQLQIISLSTNYISKLDSLCGCVDLQELYLRRNKIDDIKEILHLKNLSHLHTLWLGDNPMCNQLDKFIGDIDEVAAAQLYRAIVITTLPQIQILDDIEITLDERELVRNLSLSPLIDSVNQNLNLENDDLLVSNISEDNFQPICTKEYNSSKYMALNNTEIGTNAISENSAAELSIKSISESELPTVQNLIEIKDFNKEVEFRNEDSAETKVNITNLHQNSAVIGSAISQLIPLLEYEDLLVIKSLIESKLMLVERQ